MKLFLFGLLFLAFIIGNLKAEDFTFTEYPTEQQMQNSFIHKEWIQSAPLLQGNSRWEWLLNSVKDKKAVFIGENHWLRKTSALAQEVIFKLNKNGDFPILFLELPFSWGPFLNYYIKIVDEIKASKFFSEYLNSLVYEKDLQELLENLRAWNKINPSKSIMVATHDIEHDWKLTLQTIVIPYCKAINPNFNLTMVLELNNIPIIVTSIEKFLIHGMINDEYMNKFPFWNYQYITQVLYNITAYYNARQGQGFDENFNRIRQKAIIHNFTNYYRDVLNNNNFILWGGAQHTIKTCQGEGADYLWEGSFFNCEYPITKGKIFSLSIYGLTYNFMPMLGATSNSYMRAAYYYWLLVDSFNKKYSDGLVDPNKYYLLNDGSLDETMINILYYPFLQISNDYNQASWRITSIDLHSIKTALLQQNHSEYLEYYKAFADGTYDACIIFGKSLITEIRKL